MKFNTFLGFITLLFISVLQISCSSKEVVALPTVTAKQADSSARASFAIEKNDGLTLIRLATKDALGNDVLRLTVAPEAGSNIVSILYSGTEVLEQPISLKDVSKQDAGIEFLYPTPNRVRGGELNYKDLKLKFTPNLQNHFIHGLAREYAWDWDVPVLEGEKVVYKTRLNVDQSSDFYKRFPVKNRLEMTLTLEADQIEFAFRVENHDDRILPFGIGIHPYFKLHGSRSETSVVMNVENQMEAVDLIPTGKLKPIKKTKYGKLPRGMTVKEVLGADTVFFPTTGSAEVREPGFDFEISASKDFGHTVLWAPPTRELFAIENQTSSTDAHNLANRGRAKESGLLEVAPGAWWTGWVKYKFGKKR